MALKQEMTVTIGPDGQVEISVSGVGGKKCLEFTRWLEEELGIVTQRTHTSEYYQTEVTTETVKVDS